MVFFLSIKQLVLYALKKKNTPKGPLQVRPKIVKNEKHSQKSQVTKKGAKGETISKSNGARKLAMHAAIASRFLQ